MSAVDFWPSQSDLSAKQKGEKPTMEANIAYSNKILKKHLALPSAFNLLIKRFLFNTSIDHQTHYHQTPSYTDATSVQRNHFFLRSHPNTL